MTGIYTINNKDHEWRKVEGVPSHRKLLHSNDKKLTEKIGRELMLYGSIYVQSPRDPRVGEVKKLAEKLGCQNKEEVNDFVSEYCETDGEGRWAISEI